MKIGFKARVKTWAVIVSGFLMLLPVVSVAAPREISDPEVVALSVQEATRIAQTLDRVMTRAVRPDAPELGDPEFPPGSLAAEDLQAIRECCCLLRKKLDECCRRFDSLDECCSKIELIEERVGDCDDKSVDFCDCTNLDKIDNSNLSVIAYLKTILRELRGLVGGANYCEPCPAVSDLPENNLCPDNG